MSGNVGDSTPVLAAEGLTVRYGRTTALNEVTLEIPSGSVYALLGRNGAGKTSAIRCLLGQRRPDGGRALLFGEDAWRGRTGAMAKTGVVPEEPDAPPSMTVDQLLWFCARLYPRWDGVKVAERLERFGVPRRVPFARLSKGQRGMATLSLALGHGPDLLVMDDPTLGLDVVARKSFFEELVGELAEKGTTVFISTHDLRGVEGIGSHVGILKEGRLLLSGELDDIRARFRRIRLVAGEGAPGDLRTTLSAFTVLGYESLGSAAEAVVDGFSEEAFEAVRHASWAVEAEASALPLEDLFIALVGEGNGGAS